MLYLLLTTSVKLSACVKARQLTRRFAFIVIFVGLSAAVECRAAVLSWSGGGADANWNNSANWGFAGTPANGDTLIFSASQPKLLNTNNIAGLTLNQIRFVGPGGGYDIRGNAFTLTNNLEATNSSGANTIENDIVLAPVNQIIDVTNSLTLSGVLSGSSGIIKNGLGTLVLSGPNSNIYGGTTTVNAGGLQLAKAGIVFAATAVPGNLVIGNGVSLAGVTNIYNDEIADSANLTINSSGAWELGGWPETIGTNVTFHGSAVVSVGSGTLTLSTPTTINADGGFSSITGAGILDLGVGPCLVNSSFVLDVYPTVQGGAAITKIGGNGDLRLHGANTYTGQTVVSEGWLYAQNSLALGATTSGTVVSNGATLVLMGGIHVSNEVLTLNGPGNPDWAALDCESLETNIWAGPIIMNADSTFGNYGGGTLRIIGPISGSGGLREIYGGYLSLEGNTDNTYFGTTTVTNGTLLLGKTGGSARAIPNSLVLQDGTTARNVADYQMWTFGKAVTINTLALLDLAGHTDSVGPLTLNGGRLATGGGTVWLLDNITVLANTTTNSQINGAAYLYSNDVTISNSGHFFSPELKINATVSSGGPFGFIKNGTPGEASLAAANTFTGPVTVNAGTLWIENNNSLGNITSNVTVNAGGTLFLYGNLAIGTKPLKVNGGIVEGNFGNSSWAGNIALSGAGTFYLPDSSYGLTLSGAISGTGSLIKNGPGTLTLSGGSANTYSGLTTVSSGTLTLGKGVAIPSVPGNLIISNSATVLLAGYQQTVGTADVLVNGGGLFDFSIFATYIDTLRGAGTVNFGVGGWIYLGLNGGSSTFDGNFTGVGYSPGWTVGKDGLGTFTLNGNSTYTAGVNEILNGKMVINGSQPQIPVLLDSGGTLGGMGTVGIITANGIISPGSSPGVITSSNVIFSASGRFTVELTGPNPGAGGYDQLNVRGTNKLANATLTVIPAFTTPVSAGQTFTILNNDLSDPVSGTFLGMPEGAAIVTNGFGFRISYAGGSGNDVVLTLTNVPIAQAGFSVSLGNGSGTIDPNECDYLNVVITNKTGTPITGITATLASTTPDVAVTQPSSTYANVSASGKGTNISPFQISTSPNFPCGTNISLTMTVTSASHGTFTIPVTMTSGGQGAAVRFDNNNVTNVPDVGTIESTNIVGSWSGGAITKVAASLWLSAPSDSVLNLTLIAPDGTSVDLSSGNGAGASFGTGSADASRTTFDDAAGTNITAGSPPFVGTFQPEAPLSALIGTSPIGPWRLRIQDTGVFGSPDTLRAWSLFLYGTACAQGGGLCELCPNVTIYSATGSLLTQTNYVIPNGLPSICGVAKVCPGTVPAGPYPADNYTFRNGPSDACVTITLENHSPSAGMVAAVYSGSFNPANPDRCVNYLADCGNIVNSGNPTQTFSFNAASNATFVVNVVSGGPLPYKLTVSGGDCRPVLNITPVIGNNVKLDWTTAAAGYLLEKTNSLAGGVANWQAVTNVPAVVNSRFQVTNGPTTGNQFYRLHKP
jgi:autotransporter-associated beta strand protein